MYDCIVFHGRMRVFLMRAKGKNTEKNGRHVLFNATCSSPQAVFFRPKKCHASRSCEVCVLITPAYPKPLCALGMESERTRQ